VGRILDATLVRAASPDGWLATYRRPTRRGPGPWTVIDRAGRSLGEVALPEGLEVWEIGSDYALGEFADEPGVEHGRMYRLIKPA